MNQIYDEIIIKPLSIIYKNYIESGIFPDVWKKSNIVTVHKKGNKELKICFTATYYGHNFWENFVWFVAWVSTRKQFSLWAPVWFLICRFTLISVTLKCSWNLCFFFFNLQSDIAGVFLNISKAFNRVWHEDLIHVSNEMY